MSNPSLSSLLILTWPIAGVLVLGSPASARGAINYSGLQNIPIPANFEGVYLNVASGTSSSSAFGGWDLNFFFGGLGMANNASLLPGAMGSESSSSVRLLTLGSEINSGSLFTGGYGVSGAEDNSGHLGPGAAQFGDGEIGYFGFKLANPSADPVYGWMQVVLTRNGGGGLIRDWAYETGGGAIPAGFAGFAEPSAVTTLTSGSTTAPSSSLVGQDLQVDSAAEVTLAESSSTKGTFSGTLAGSGKVNITGEGGLQLSGTNPFSGTIDVGTSSNLTVNNNQNLGSASVVLREGAALVFDASSSNDTERNTFRNTIAVDAAADTLLENRGTGVVTLSGVLEGDASGSLTKTGSGVVILGGDLPNTFSGTTVVEGGELQLNKVGGANAIGGNLTISGGTLNLAGSNQIEDSSQLTLSAGGSLIFTGSGLTETIGTLTNTGGTFNTGANALIGSGNSIYWSGSSVNTIADGGSMADAHFAISGGTNVVAGGVSGGVLTVLSGGAGLELSQGATLILNSDSAVPGKLVLQGNVSVTGDSTATIASGLALANRGTIDLDGGTRTFAVADGAAATDLLVSGTLTHGGLIKAGSGSMQLSAANSYTGSTTITGGTLELIGASASLSATSSFSVDGGTLLLTGTGGSAVHDAAPITLGGSSAAKSALQLSGAVAETWGTLTLSGTAGVRVIDFGSGSGTLTFSLWEGATSGVSLQVWNWNGNAYLGGGTDRLIITGGFGSNLALSDISFFSDSGTSPLGSAMWVEGTAGELVTVPEAGGLGAALALLAPLLWRERRHWARLPAARLRADTSL